MNNASFIRTYDRIIRVYRKLQMSVSDLIKASGAKHQEIWTRLGFKKDTFYRRMRLQDWSSRELQVIIPFLINKAQINNPELYTQLIEKSADDDLLFTK